MASPFSRYPSIVSSLGLAVRFFHSFQYPSSCLSVTIICDLLHRRDSVSTVGATAPLRRYCWPRSGVVYPVGFCWSFTDIAILPSSQKIEAAKLHQLFTQTVDYQRSTMIFRFLPQLVTFFTGLLPTPAPPTEPIAPPVADPVVEPPASVETPVVSPGRSNRVPPRSTVTGVEKPPSDASSTTVASPGKSPPHPTAVAAEATTALKPPPESEGGRETVTFSAAPSGSRKRSFEAAADDDDYKVGPVATKPTAEAMEIDLPEPPHEVPATASMSSAKKACTGSARVAHALPASLKANQKFVRRPRCSKTTYSYVVNFLDKEYDQYDWNDVPIAGEPRTKLSAPSLARSAWTKNDWVRDDIGDTISELIDMAHSCYQVAYASADFDQDKASENAVNACFNLITLVNDNHDIHRGVPESKIFLGHPLLRTVVPRKGEGLPDKYWDVDEFRFKAKWAAMQYVAVVVMMAQYDISENVGKFIALTSIIQLQHHRYGLPMDFVPSVTAEAWWDYPMSYAPSVVSG